MAISLADISKQEREITFEFDGEQAAVTYNLRAYTPELESWMQKVFTQEGPANSNAAILSRVLVAWDVLDENGEQFPTDKATLVRFPNEFLEALLNAITLDVRGEREERKNSQGGSPQQAGKARARTGTR
jgi:hypothetical protein